MNPRQIKTITTVVTTTTFQEPMTFSKYSNIFTVFHKGCLQSKVYPNTLLEASYSTTYNLILPIEILMPSA